MSVDVLKKFAELLKIEVAALKADDVCNDLFESHQFPPFKKRQRCGQFAVANCVLGSLASPITEISAKTKRFPPPKSARAPHRIEHGNYCSSINSN